MRWVGAAALAVAMLAAAGAAAENCYVQKTESIDGNGCQVWTYVSTWQQEAPAVGLPWRRDGAWYDISRRDCVANTEDHARQSAAAQAGAFRCWRVIVNGQSVAAGP